MQWLGLGATLAALLFGASAALLTALYLVRRRPTRAEVPLLALWETLRLARSSGLFGRLRRPLSLLLGLCFVLLLVLALADPRMRPREGRSLVVLLDRGAAMAARDERPNRLAHAAELVGRLASTLSRSDRALLLALDARATPLTGWTQQPAELVRAARAAVPSPDSADLEQGVQRALQLLRGARRAEIVLVSAGALRGVEGARHALSRAPRVKVRQILVGHEQRNLAITALSARPYPLDRRHHEVLVSAHNAGPRRERARLSLSLEGTPLFVEDLWLDPHSSVTRSVPDLVQRGGELHAVLEPQPTPDALAADNHARTQLPDARALRVLLVSPGNRYLEAALLLDESLEVSFCRPGEAFDAAHFDVAIFDRTLPQGADTLPALLLAPYVMSPLQPLPSRGTLTRPYIDRYERDHPLLQGLALADVNISRAARTQATGADRVLASTAASAPLIVEGQRDERRFIALTFDPRESDLPLRPAFPLFVLAAIDRLAHGEQASEIPAASATRATAESSIAPRALFAPLEPNELPTRAALVPRAFPWQLLLLAALVLLALEWLAYELRPSA